MSSLDPRSTALILIDLQNGILAPERFPYASDIVVARAKALADRFRAAGAPVVLVRVAFSPDFGDVLRQPVDAPLPRPAGGFPPDWATLVDGLAQPGDILITKRQWGAFYGTELDLQLRRRGIRSFVIGGVATNFGVESTVRDGWELGYEVVVAEDVCSTVSVEMHEFAIRNLFPRIARVTTSDAISLDAR